MCKKKIFISRALIYLFFAMLIQADSVTLWANPGPPHWQMINQSGPARYGHQCAFDIARDVIVLFGGKDALDQMPSDLWEFNNRGNPAWTQIQNSDPEGRIGHGLWYDNVNNVTVLFGGQNQAGQFLNDTWIWNGTSWTKVDSTGPAPRAYFAFAYDTDQQRAILFGGANADSVYRDTWEWDGAHWILLPTSGPPPRIMASMAYFPIYNQHDYYFLLFGGLAGFDGPALNDTWIWADTGWSQIQIIDPPAPRAGQAMASKVAINEFSNFIMLGGQNAISPDTVFDEIWGFNDYDTEWVNLFFGNHPSARSMASMVSISFYEILLIGGTDGTHVFNDVWFYPIFFHYVVGDVNGSDIFNGQDVVYAVAYFRGGPPPPYSEPCPPPHVLYVAGDVNSSCSFNGLDVTYMVAYFKGGPGPRPCPSCPP